MEIKIKNVSTYITASVASHLVTDLLLGADWINRYVVSIQPSQQSLQIHDDHGRSTSAPLVRPPDPSYSSVTLIHQTILAPYSESTVDVHIPDSDPRHMLFEPSSMFHRTPISVPPSLINIHQHRSRLLLRNPTDRAYTLSQNTCLGVVTPFRVLCGTACSSVSTSTSRPRSNLHRCYVCRRDFLSNNDLYRHLRDTCYPQELREHITTLTNHLLDTSAQTKVQSILWKHAKLFDTTQPSKIDFLLDNAINTGDHRPVYTTPYRRSPTDHQAIDNETQILLRNEHIQPSTSPWCSPVVLVRKKDGTTRFCVDYRRLNEITTKDSFPLPRLDDIFDQLSGSRYFTKLDLKSGYFQVPLAPGDRPKTAFSTRDNHYEFTVLPQGVKNGPPTFQRMMNQILGPTRWKYCLAYLDDILIFSDTFSEHLAHLDEVLQLLSTANFRLSVGKCTIATDHVEYLGHSISHGVLRPNTDNIRGLLETPNPTSSRELFRFVKAAEYYRKFIRNFSTLAAPLYKHAPSQQQSSSPRKPTVFCLTPEETEAFARLKHILTNDLVLRLPDLAVPFKVQTDASQIGIGAVLLQTTPEGDRPVCYLSKKLTPSQQRWPAIEQECYAIVTAIQLWHHYLHGRHFILETDHRPLEALMKKTQLNSKCERWRLLLQTYDFTVKHISGVSNTMPDYLSRSPVDPSAEDLHDAPAMYGPASVSLDPSSPGVNVVTTRSHTRQLQRSSHAPSVSPPSADSISTQSPAVMDRTFSPDSDELRIDFTGNLDTLRLAQASDVDFQFITNNITDPRFAKNYKLTDGILMHFDSGSTPVPCVPRGKIRRDIMLIYHDTPANGAHFGRDKTLRKIRDRYYWDSMNTDISNHIQSCLHCRANNPIRRKPSGHLQPIASPEGVWQLLSMDFHGPITPISRRGNRYIISLTDVFSKFVITRAVRDCTTATAARFLQEDVICRYGTPKCILTDNGTHFSSSLMDHLFKRLGIVHLYSTVYHPQTNGQIERFNSTMDAKIASLSNQSRSDWDDQLPFVTLNYNTSIHSTTKIVPFELMYGRSPILPCDPQNPIVSLPADPHYVEKLTARISSLSQTAHRNITTAQAASKSRYDMNRSNPSYQVNDLVLLRNLNRRYKFDVRFEGPYRVLRLTGPKTYVLQHVQLPTVVRTVTVDSIIPLFARSLV